MVTSAPGIVVRAWLGKVTPSAEMMVEAARAILFGVERKCRDRQWQRDLLMDVEAVDPKTHHNT